MHNTSWEMAHRTSRSVVLILLALAVAAISSLHLAAADTTPTAPADDSTSDHSGSDSTATPLTDATALTDEIAPTTVPAPTSTAVPAPTTTQPPGRPRDELYDISEFDAHCDLIFGLLMQSCAVEIQLRAVLGNLLGISARRIMLTPSFVNCRLGHRFGDQFRLRLTIRPRTVAEAQEAPTVHARDFLVATFAQSQELANLHIVNVDSVPDDPLPYVFKVYTAWDILYTLLIIAAGLGFVGFIGFVVVKFRNARRWSEKEAQEAEEEELAKKSGRGKASAALDAEEDGDAAEGAAFSLTRTDVDSESRAVLEQAIGVLARASRRGGCVVAGDAERSSSSSAATSSSTGEGRNAVEGEGAAAAATAGKGRGGNCHTTAQVHSSSSTPINRAPRRDGDGGDTPLQDRAPHHMSAAVRYASLLQLPPLHAYSDEVQAQHRRNGTSSSGGAITDESVL